MVIENGAHSVVVNGPFNLRMSPEMHQHLVTQLVAQREPTRGEVLVQVPHVQPSLAHLTPRRLGEV